MKLKLKNRSHLLVGSGEGSALIDTDLVFDGHGFPFITGRRLKGLLRESAVEVAEMTGIDPLTDEIEQIFGTSTMPAIVRWPNLYPASYQESKSKLDLLKSIKGNEVKGLTKLLSEDVVKRYYTRDIQQTSLANGVAKDGSLRSYRVLKKGHDFEGQVFVENCSLKQKALLQLAVVNLKHIGVRRNRGFGWVEAELEEAGEKNPSIEELLQQLRSNDHEPSSESSESVVAEQIQTETGEMHILPFQIQTNSPVIFARQQGEQNTVATQNYIPAPAIRGMLANRLIHIQHLGLSAHQDHLFYASFLDSTCTVISNARFEGTIPSPRSLQVKKGSEDNHLYDVLEQPLADENGPLITKAIDSWLTLDENGSYQEKSIRKTFYFHTSRKEDRKAARNSDGTIFYYESIDPGQTFSGAIISSHPCLKSLKKVLGKSFPATIGRSRSAQYGSVNFSFGSIEPYHELEPGKPITKEAYLVATSPIILYNNYGFADPSAQQLEQALMKRLGEKSKVSVSKLRLGSTMVENYMGTWRSKVPSEQAIEEGSVIKITFEGDLAMELGSLEHQGIGERTHEGYGQLKIFPALDRFSKLMESPPITINDLPKEPTPLLRKIATYSFNHYLEKYILQMAMKGAKQDAKSKASLNNHQIGRVQAMVAQAENKEDWLHNYLYKAGKKDKKEGEKVSKGRSFKPLGESLHSGQLWTRLEAFDEDMPTWQENVSRDFDDTTFKWVDRNRFLKGPFEQARLYWLTYFRTLRKLTSIQESNGN